jgi:5'-nucleotidase
MSQGKNRLVLLHTNDLHSHFEQMPRIAAFFKQKRNLVGSDHLLTLDIGDHMDRMHAATDGTAGQANVEVMNATGYDAAVLGNNEGLTFTPDTLRNCYLNRAHFPIIGSNIKEIKTGETPNWMVPYAIVQKGSMKIGLIGVTAAYQAFYEELGWDVTDPLESVSYWVKKLRPQADLIVVMSHLGYRNDERMAKEISGIDIILGGHTHHVIPEPNVFGSAHVCAAGKFGQYIGEVEIEYMSEEDEIRILGITGRLLETNDLPEDDEVVQIIQENTSKSSIVLSQEITILDDPLSIDWYEESVLGNLLASGLKKWTNADIGIVNAGQLLRGLPEGKVTRGQLLEICPGPINPCIYSLHGYDLREALEQSLLPEFTQKQIRGFGFRGEVLGTLCIDGLTVEYDLMRQPMDRITAIQFNNESFVEEREYRVGTIDMFTFGVGYLSLSKGTRTKYLLPEFLRDVLGDQLQSKEEIRRAKRHRFAQSTS